MIKMEPGPGTKLLLIDDLAPEDLAMLQALYSRSAESAETHLEKVRQAGSGKFMSKFYIGYNHKSIADCGTTTMFIEGVSMLAAKAVQDWPLYSGQETSTRFIDMGKQRIADPLKTDRSGQVLDAWMKFYTTNQERVADTVRQRYPVTPAEKENPRKVEAYENAVKARTFDILRGFLPAGITTQLSWHTNLRQAGDHLATLVNHPAEEIRGIAGALGKMFAEQYPSSGDVTQAAVSAVTDEGSARAARLAWEKSVATRYTYPGQHHRVAPGGMALRSTIHKEELAMMEEACTRPRGCVLPHFMSDLGQLSFSFHLDFGSFRDIQRHRNGVCRMPLLTTAAGFEPWYLEQLDDELRQEAKDLIAYLTGAIGTITDDPIQRQYYTAMGFRVPCQVTYALPAAVYVMELRSGKTIHPTLRRAIHGMIGEFRKEFPTFTLHVDEDPDGWTVRRGSQTITAKSV